MAHNNEKWPFDIVLHGAIVPLVNFSSQPLDRPANGTHRVLIMEAYLCHKVAVTMENQGPRKGVYKDAFWTWYMPMYMYTKACKCNQVEFSHSIGFDFICFKYIKLYTFFETFTYMYMWSPPLTFRSHFILKHAGTIYYLDIHMYAECPFNILHFESLKYKLHRTYDLDLWHSLVLKEERTIQSSTWETCGETETRHFGRSWLKCDD